MGIMAVLSPAGIRRDLLHAAGKAGVLASGGRRVTAALVDRALARLAELVAADLQPGRPDRSIVHRLVSQVVRDGLARREWLTSVCRAAASLLEARAQALAGSQDRPAVRDIPEQVTALLDNAAGPAVQTDKELARVLLRLRFLALYHLIELGDSASQAVAVGEPLTADLEWVLGPDHPDTLNSRNSLAAAYQAADRVAEAIPLFEQTLVSRERLLGPDHPDTLNSRNNLANAYQDAGRVAEAIPLHEQTLAACERLLGADHPEHVDSRRQPRGRLPGRGPGRRGDPAVRADPGCQVTGPGRRPSRHPDVPEQPRRRPTGRRAGPPRRSRSSSRPSPPANGCSAPTIPEPWPRGTTSPPPTGTWAGLPRRSRCSSRP